jgi:hypothetical protein
LRQRRRYRVLRQRRRLRRIHIHPRDRDCSRRRWRGGGRRLRRLCRTRHHARVLAGSLRCRRLNRRRGHRGNGWRWRRRKNGRCRRRTLESSGSAPGFTALLGRRRRGRVLRLHAAENSRKFPCIARRRSGLYHRRAFGRLLERALLHRLAEETRELTRAGLRCRGRRRQCRRCGRSWRCRGWSNRRLEHPREFSRRRDGLRRGWRLWGRRRRLGR